MILFCVALSNFRTKTVAHTKGGNYDICVSLRAKIVEACAFKFYRASLLLLCMCFLFSCRRPVKKKL